MKLKLFFVIVKFDCDEMLLIGEIFEYLVMCLVENKVCSCFLVDLSLVIGLD